MEVFTGDRQTQNDADFPDNLTPFPEPADVLYHGRAADVRLPGIEHRSQLPPQKLRPIRCNGRSLPEYSDPTALEDGGLDGTLLGCHGVASSELGFLTHMSAQTLGVANGGPKDGCCTPTDLETGALLENSVAGDPRPLVDMPAVPQIKSKMNIECANLISDGRILEAQLSSSSDDGEESSEATTEPLNRKRKRKAMKRLELFLENMMERVIQKQEQMHKQLIEMIEKKERERIIREEAWKQQEIARAKRDEEVRAQETSRSLALISFIQNLLGQEIEIPKRLEASSLEKDEGEIHNKKYNEFEPSNRRWPKSEVQALITVRTALDHKFLGAPKGPVWEEVAVEMSNMGYNRTAKKCKEKWENINKYYKRTTENGKKRLENGKTCPYFQELDVIYKSGLINPGSVANPTKDEIEDKDTKKQEGQT